MDDECPICKEDLTGTLTTLGCCKKVLHAECFIRALKEKLECPMCRARHESLRMIQDPESQVLVPIAVQYRNRNFFRDSFFCALATCIVILSFRV